MNSWQRVAMIALCCGSACGSDGGGSSVDGSAADAPVADAPTPDAPTPDAVPPDARPPDATLFDAMASCQMPVSPPGHVQFVIDSFVIPDTASEANINALNLDDDPQGRPDNALGAILSALASQGPGPTGQDETDAALASGALIELVDVEAADLVTASGVTWRHFKGVDCDVPANAADNLNGDEPLGVDVASPLDSQLTGDIAGSAFAFGPGNLTIRIAMLGAGPISLPLIGARATGTINSSGIMTGKIGGAIPQEKLTESLIRPWAMGMTATVNASCTGTPVNCPGAQCRPCGCTTGSAGRDLLDLFDESPADCAITESDLENSSLVSSLLAPDVDLRDSTNGDVFAPRTDGIKDALSLGIGFTATTARFELPASE